MFNTRHHNPIGIDIHSRGVCALQLHTSRQGARVRTTARLPLEIPCTGTPEEINSLCPTLKLLKKEFPFRGKRTVVSLPPEYMVSFPVTFELEPRQSLEAALVLACRKHLTFPVEEAVIDYLYVQVADGGRNRQRRASIVAARHSRITQVLQVFRKAGLGVGVIDFNLSALLRLHALAHSLTEAPTILVHIGEEATLLAVASRREIVAHRHLNWGVGRLQRRLAENMQILPDTPQTMNMLHEHGLAYGALQAGQGSEDAAGTAAKRVVSQILVPYLEDLVHEIYQLIGYTRSLSPDIRFEEICLYGMAIEVKDLEAYLQDRLQITTRGIDPFARLALEEDRDPGNLTSMQPYVYALGLALRGTT